MLENSLVSGRARGAGAADEVDVDFGGMEVSECRGRLLIGDVRGGVK